MSETTGHPGNTKLERNQRLRAPKSRSHSWSCDNSRSPVIMMYICKRSTLQYRYKNLHTRPRSHLNHCRQTRKQNSWESNKEIKIIFEIKLINLRWMVNFITYLIEGILQNMNFYNIIVFFFFSIQISPSSSCHSHNIYKNNIFSQLVKSFSKLLKRHSSCMFSCKALWKGLISMISFSKVLNMLSKREEPQLA